MSTPKRNMSTPERAMMKTCEPRRFCKGPARIRIGSARMTSQKENLILPLRLVRQAFGKRFAPCCSPSLPPFVPLRPLLQKSNESILVGRPVWAAGWFGVLNRSEALDARAFGARLRFLVAGDLRSDTTWAIPWAFLQVGMSVGVSMDEGDRCVSRRVFRGDSRPQPE